MDCSPPDSSAHGISHARVQEWVAISFSRGSSWPRDRTTQVSYIAGGFFIEPPEKPKAWTNSSIYHIRIFLHSKIWVIIDVGVTHACMCQSLNHVQFFATSQSPSSSICGIYFSGKSTRVGCHFLLQRIFLTQGLNLYPALQADSLPPEPSGKPINTDIYGFILWVWGDNAYEILPQCMTNWKHSYVMDILKILVLKSLLPPTWDLVSARVKTLHPMEGALPRSSVISFSNISIWISWI